MRWQLSTHLWWIRRNIRSKLHYRLSMLQKAIHDTLEDEVKCTTSPEQFRYHFNNWCWNHLHKFPPASGRSEIEDKLSVLVRKTACVCVCTCVYTSKAQVCVFVWREGMSKQLIAIMRPSSKAVPKWRDPVKSLGISRWSTHRSRALSEEIGPPIR